MRRIACLQHVPFEGPGRFAKLLAERGFELESRLVPRDGLPRGAPDALLVMGGPMSVNDPDPWIRGELDYIRESVARGIPYLGICLGSQFLARAVGGAVAPGARSEIGMTRIDLTEHAALDPLFHGLPSPLEVFEWHGEGITLPAGATVLASSADFPVQAFRFGRAAYGILFHVEIEAAGIDALCARCPDDLARARRTAEEVEAESFAHLEALHAAAAKIASGFASLVTA